MPNISQEKLQSDIEEIFKEADLTKLSSRMIRQKLQEQYGFDLADRKSDIEAIAMDLLDKYTNNKPLIKVEKPDPEKPNPEKPTFSNKRKRPDSDNSDDNDDNDELSDDNNSDASLDDNKKRNGNAVVKKEVKVLTNGAAKRCKTESESDEENVTNDESLARQLQEEEEKMGTRRTRHGKKKEPVKKSKKSKKTSTKGVPRKNSYTEECNLSPELSALLGEAKLKRCDVVKRMWEIVKERNLFFPKNKQYMICDDDMYSIFGKKKVRLFGMMKHLSSHIYKPDEVI